MVTEIMGESQLDDFADVDVIQVGARNMQNFRLLKELGRACKPILLKRGLSATIEEFLMSAEYIMAGGNPTSSSASGGFAPLKRWCANNLDISAVPLLKRQSPSASDCGSQPTRRAWPGWWSPSPGGHRRGGGRG